MQLKISIEKMKCTANKYLVNPEEGRKYGTDKEQKGHRENKTQEGRLKSNHVNNFIKCKGEWNSLIKRACQDDYKARNKYMVSTRHVL